MLELVHADHSKLPAVVALYTHYINLCDDSNEAARVSTCDYKEHYGLEQ